MFAAADEGGKFYVDGRVGVVWWSGIVVGLIVVVLQRKSFGRLGAKRGVPQITRLDGYLHRVPEENSANYYRDILESTRSPL